MLNTASTRALMLYVAAGAAAFASEIAGGDDVFAARPICCIQIELSPQNFESLRVEGRKYVRATVRVWGEVFREVGIHLKGSTGSFRPLDDKPSFTLDFGRFLSGQKFGGLAKVHLNNSVEDPSCLREQIGSELFRSAKVPAPRVSHALVELNGRPLGLYVLKEGFTEEFLARHFKRAEGNLYDTDEGHDVNLRMKQHLGRDSADDQSDLQRLAAAAAESDPRRRWERLQETLAVDQFLTFAAMEVMVCHWDGYCLGRNNFRIYHDPETGKLVFLPSGMDQIFSKADLPWKPNMRGLVAHAILETPEGRREYAARFKALLETLFDSGRLTNRVSQLLAELRPFTKAEELRTMVHEAADLCAQIRAREISLRNQLIAGELAIPNFQNRPSSLKTWQAMDEPAGGTMREAKTPEGKPAFQIAAGPRTSASWRTTVRLSPGRYQFRGEAKVIRVNPLPFGENQGARLRVAGRSSASSKLAGTSAWETLAADFEVTAPEEEVVLMCELRASAGEAWFAKDSLVIVRLP